MCLIYLGSRSGDNDIHVPAETPRGNFSYFVVYTVPRIEASRFQVAAALVLESCNCDSEGQLRASAARLVRMLHLLPFMCFPGSLY